MAAQFGQGCNPVANAKGPAAGSGGGANGPIAAPRPVDAAGDVEPLFDAVYGRAGYSHYPELTKLGILSAIEMACWDLIGKDCGQPVHKLLGGQMRDRVRTYIRTSTTIPSPAAAAPPAAAAGHDPLLLRRLDRR